MEVQESSDSNDLPRPPATKQLSSGSSGSGDGSSQESQESGYFSLPSQSSVEQKAHFAMDGHKPEFWGICLRTCNILKQAKEGGEYLPQRTYCHDVTHVLPGRKMEQLGAKPGFRLEDIDGEPTATMDGLAIEKKLQKCEEEMKSYQRPINFKFLEVTDENNGYWLWVNLKLKGDGTGDITVVESRRTPVSDKEDVQTDDDGDVFVGSLLEKGSNEFILMQPSAASEVPAYFIFSDGTSVEVKKSFKHEDRHRYLFRLDSYQGTYKGKDITSSLKSGVTVKPTVIRLPNCEKIIAAKERTCDIADYSHQLDQNIDEEHEKIHQPHPGLFFLQRVTSSDIVLRSTEAGSLRFLGVDEGELKALLPNGKYSDDRRLYFNRVIPTSVRHYLAKVEYETSV